jgi:hypothetical protein
MINGFPDSRVVLPGCLLAYLVDCIMTAQNRLFSTCTWEDHGFFARAGHAVYGTNDGEGIYGAIVFQERSLVGIFYNSNSKRAPYQCPDTYDLDRFFRGMPPRQRSLIREPLKDFVVQVDGREIPSVTTAFWDEGDHLTAADPWDVVLRHGAKLVRVELMEDIDEALGEWQEDYDMTPEQVAFARLLFNRKMAQREGTIELTLDEAGCLESTSEEPSGEGMAACREKLAAIGIRIPSP